MRSSGLGPGSICVLGALGGLVGFAALLRALRGAERFCRAPVVALLRVVTVSSAHSWPPVPCVPFSLSTLCPYGLQVQAHVLTLLAWVQPRLV